MRAKINGVSLVIAVFLVIMFGAAYAGPGHIVTEPVQYITGIYYVEDMVVVPDTDWVITSSYQPQGHLGLVNASTRTFAGDLFPGPKVGYRLDAATYGAVTPPPDEKPFYMHGVNLRLGKNGIHTLYAISHIGEHERVEVFEVKAKGANEPEVTWIGAIEAQPYEMLNGIGILPDGGIVVSNFARDFGASALRGEPTGYIYEWHNKELGLQLVPGGFMNTPNGLEASPDGRWLFVNSWVGMTMSRISHGVGPVQVDRIPTGFLADNLKWNLDGSSLLVTGQRTTVLQYIADLEKYKYLPHSFSVLKVNPWTLQGEEIIRYDQPDIFGSATVALEVKKNEIWVTGAHSDKILIFKMD